MLPQPSTHSTVCNNSRYSTIAVRHGYRRLLCRDGALHATIMHASPDKQTSLSTTTAVFPYSHPHAVLQLPSFQFLCLKSHVSRILRVHPIVVLLSPVLSSSIVSVCVSTFHNPRRSRQLRLCRREGTCLVVLPPTQMPEIFASNSLMS
jgi:hypothetical protein